MSKYPSVTEILAPYSGYDRVPPHLLDAASARGSLVHAHCAAIAKEEWAPAPRQEARGYIVSFQKWFDAFVDKVLFVEGELEDPELGYCGHPDLIVKSRKLGGVILPDLKTPAGVKKVWGSQLAGYENLSRKDKRISLPPIDRLGSLRLDKDGAMAKFDEFTENLLAYFGAFYAALAAHKFFMEGK